MCRHIFADICDFLIGMFEFSLGCLHTIFAPNIIPDWPQWYFRMIFVIDILDIICLTF